MKKLKSHFWYTKNQRNGILFLLALILVLQATIHFTKADLSEEKGSDTTRVLAFKKQIDSLKQLALETRKPNIYPFNPNFITDYKGYQLGMSVQEIDRLTQYRKKGLFVNSSKEFQKVTKVSDSFLKVIEPYFKFPDWVQRKTQKKTKKELFNHTLEKGINIISTTDLNLATSNDFLAIKGVDESLSERIIKYRTKLQGFSVSDQLFEVWGIDQETGERILETFSIQTRPNIKKININTASFKEVLKTPYIDYELCVKIFDFRDEVAELQSISELKQIEGFPLKKYDRIVLYLLAK